MIKFKEKKPTLEEYQVLRNAVSWNLADRGISDERAQESLDKCSLCICAYDDDRIIGMVRLAGDLEMYGYIQDTIVLPEYQGKGIGTKILQRVIDHIKDKRGYLLGVCPSKVSVDFYEKFGFKKRPENPNGFMSMEIS